MIQLDEPKQKNFVYKIVWLNESKPEEDQEEEVTKYFQLRVKSIDFLEVQAIAIYLYDVTHHIQSLKLLNEMQDHKMRHKKIANSQTILSHEFRTPLTTILMFLESLLQDHDLREQVISMLLVIVSQTNMLLSLVNDMMDNKLIEAGIFEPKLARFHLKDTFDFILKMFKPYMQIK